MGGWCSDCVKPPLLDSEAGVVRFVNDGMRSRLTDTATWWQVNQPKTLKWFLG